MIIMEHGPEGAPVFFDAPDALFTAWSADEVASVLARAEDARAGGAWIAGCVGYEAGYALEPRLWDHMPEKRSEPLVTLAAYNTAPKDAATLLAQADLAGKDAMLAPLKPAVSRAAYSAAFKTVSSYIRAGDCYQVNLTFPIETQCLNVSALGLYGALRVGAPVGYGSFVDLGEGPAIISRSPELFFQLAQGGGIESRPMKGTAPRAPDPVDDAALAAGLRASDKVRAENLMIVDLLRNDIARVAQVGSVRVPELFCVESFSTVHQMSSTIKGRLSPESMRIPALMAALFPCGSITGAPKIRAMQIIREVEPFARGAYCGALGWAAPDGRQCWSVAIRTARLWPTGRVVLNVGGGVVYDSTDEGEWEEALWKARYAARLVRPDSR